MQTRTTSMEETIDTDSDDNDCEMVPVQTGLEVQVMAYPPATGFAGMDLPLPVTGLHVLEAMITRNRLQDAGISSGIKKKQMPRTSWLAQSRQESRFEIVD